MTHRASTTRRRPMVTNQSRIDRGVRVGGALTLLVLATVVGLASLNGIVLTGLALALIVTAGLGWCPLYRLYGVSTVHGVSRQSRDCLFGDASCGALGAGRTTR